MQPSNPPDLAQLELPAELPSLEKFQAFILERMDSANLSPKVLLKIELVLEELLLNIFKNAYAPAQNGLVEVTCGMLGDDQGFLVRFKDQGRPFDPISLPPPDVTLGMDEREIGGLGILLVKEMSRSQRYRREGDSNIFEIIFDA